MIDQTASSLTTALDAIATEQQKEETARFFFDGVGDTQVLGVPIGKIFPVAKRHRDLPLADIEHLLDSPFYELRMAAVAVVDFQARQKHAVNSLKSLYDLYLRPHDRLNNWDFVDRAAPHVVGQYLANEPRAALYELAMSSDPWRRRTAIVATWYFIRTGDLEDVFAISELLIDDRHPMIEKAIGSWLRAAGDVNAQRLHAFLFGHRDRLSATVLRMASEKWNAEEKAAIRKSR